MNDIDSAIMEGVRKGYGTIHLRNRDSAFTIDQGPDPSIHADSVEFEVPITVKGRRVKPPKNGVFRICPVRDHMGWAFTDQAAGLQDEPFVGEINDMIDVLVSGIPNAKKGFVLYFASTPIPKFQMSFTLIKDEVEQLNEIGATYKCDQLGIEGWLCPALFCYFETRPERIYVRAEKLRK